MTVTTLPCNMRVTPSVQVTPKLKTKNTTCPYPKLCSACSLKRKKKGINTGNPTVNSQSSTFGTCVDAQNMTIADRFSRTAFVHSSTRNGDGGMKWNKWYSTSKKFRQGMTLTGSSVGSAFFLSYGNR
jgi:hypothetical protein